MASKNYYEILGVPKTATQKEIKKAYRELAKKHHPDKGGDAEEFKKISEAFSILSDDNKRKRYDAFGDESTQSNTKYTNEDLKNMYADFFRNSHYAMKQKGDNLRIKISLTLSEIFNGVNKKVKYNRIFVCDSCNGTGAASASSIHVCQICNGTGITQSIRRTMVGTIIQQETCRSCGGSGQKIDSVCPVCNGKKVKTKEAEVELSIPKGVSVGDGLIFKGAGGESTEGGESGDLHIIIDEIKHDYFTRQNYDLIVKQKISIYDAIFGKEIEIKTIEDTTIKIQIKPGTQSGINLKVEGKGLYFSDSNHRGNLYIIINVFIPKTLSKKEKEVLETLKDSENINPKTL
jgi:molecular chaperone DnaJ